MKTLKPTDDQPFDRDNNALFENENVLAQIYSAKFYVTDSKIISAINKKFVVQVNGKWRGDLTVTDKRIIITKKGRSLDEKNVFGTIAINLDGTKELLKDMSAHNGIIINNFATMNPKKFLSNFLLPVYSKLDLYLPFINGIVKKGVLGKKLKIKYSELKVLNMEYKYMFKFNPIEDHLLNNLDKDKLDKYKNNMKNVEKRTDKFGARKLRVFTQKMYIELDTSSEAKTVLDILSKMNFDEIKSYIQNRDEVEKDYTLNRISSKLSD